MMLRFKMLLSVLILLVFNTMLQATTNYWIGEAGTSIAPEAWNQATNQSTTSGGTGDRAVPGSNDIAVFDMSANVRPIVDVNNLNATLQNNTFTKRVTAIAKEYHVDPLNGNSSVSATGTLTDPFKTIVQAQTAVRANNGNMSSDIVVYLHGGTYQLYVSLTFSNTDGGTNGFNVVYKAYNSDKPVIAGGKAITGWTPVSGKSYWKAIVPPAYGYASYMRNIFVNGRRAIQARGPFITPHLFNYEDPNSTSYHDGVFVKTTDLKNYSNVTDIKFFQCGAFKHIEIPVTKIVQATATESAIAMKQPSFYQWTNTYTYQYPLARPFRLINAFEELDEPGEFYHDRSTATIYYYPRADENMNTATVMAPAVETLMKVTGTTSSFVNNLRFEGIAFQYGNWSTWATKEIGRSQADLYSDYTAIEGQIQLQYTNNITFKACRFEHLLGSGIYLPDNNNNTTIQGNVFNDLTCAAVLVGKDMTPSATVNNNTLIDNNVIRSIGADFYQASGIYANVSNNLTITHNDVSDVAYFGINQRYTIPTFPTASAYVGNTVIKYNKVSNFGTSSVYGFGLEDVVAAYYFFGVQNSVINNNYALYAGNKPLADCIRQDQGGLNNQYCNNVAECKPAIHSFSYFGGDSIHRNLLFNNNYGNMISVFPVSKGATATNFFLESNAPATPWSAPAQAIIDSAGLQPAYKPLLSEFGPDVYDTNSVPAFDNTGNWSYDLVGYTKPTRYPVNKDIALFKMMSGHTTDISMQHDSILLNNTVNRRAIFTGALYGNEYVRFRALLRGVTDTHQPQISFRAPNLAVAEVPRYYFSFSKTAICLYRVNQDLTTKTLIGSGGSISVAVTNSTKICTTGSTVDIYSNNESNGMHIILLIDGVKIIDCVDTSAGYLTNPGVLMFNSSSPATIILSTSPDVVNVTGVSLNVTTKTMKPGDSFNLIPTLTPTNVTYPDVVYSSSNTAVATVSATGVVTAKATGTARITVTTRDGNFVAYCDINASLTALNSIDDGGKLKAWISPGGNGSYTLNIQSAKQNEPFDINVYDMLGKNRLELKSVVSDQDVIHLQTNRTEYLPVGIARIKYRSGESLSVKVNFGINR